MIQQIGYCEPETLQDACNFLEEHGEKARIIAGGQSLIPLMKLNLVEIDYVIDLKRIPGLSFIRVEQGNEDEDQSSSKSRFLSIGALTTHSEIEHSSLVKKLCPLLTDTVKGIGHPQIRNRGTIGGSLCHADPAADLIPTILSLEGKIVSINKHGSRRVTQAKDFFTGPYSTSLPHSELVEQIQIPLLGAEYGYSFKKFILGHGGFPIVTVSVMIRMEKGVCHGCAISIGGVSERPMRFQPAEESLINTEVQALDISNAANLAAKEAKPEADIDVSSNYKRKIVAVLVKRALEEARDRMKE